MPARVIVACLILTSLVSAQKHRPGLFVAPNATDVKWLPHGRGEQLTYQVVEDPYPRASKTLKFIQANLRAKGWHPLKMDFLNQDIPSSHVRGWQEFEDDTRSKSPMHVRVWQAQWEDGKGNLVEYGLRYVTPKDQASDDWNKLKIYGIYIPKMEVTEMRTAVKNFQKAKQ